MRKNLVTLAVMALIAGTFMPVHGNAAPAQNPASLVEAIDQAGLLQPVAQGCGPGWYRGAYGRCRPMGGGGGGVVVQPGLRVGPVVVAPACVRVRRCGPYGCRSVCR
jgi:hypothetical protein